MTIANETARRPRRGSAGEIGTEQTADGAFCSVPIISQNDTPTQVKFQLALASLAARYTVLLVDLEAQSARIDARLAELEELT